MRLIVYVIGCLLFISCSRSFKRNFNESKTLEKIIYQRTEGLLVLEKILNNTQHDDISIICEEIKLFYEYSQPYLLELCYNRELNLTMSDYNDIHQQLELMASDSLNHKDFLIEKLLDNLYQQKSNYLNVLDNQELISLHMYTLESYLQVMSFVDALKGVVQDNYMNQ